MMGEEGLHGWIDREISESRYGIIFDVPTSYQLADANNPDIKFYLEIAYVKDKSHAEDAGLKKDDLIVGAAASIISGDQKIPSSKLLEELATISNVESILIVHE